MSYVDFFLPDYNIVIFCDGDYWHNKEKMRKKDKEVDKILKNDSYVIYRFWEHEINKSPEKCINSILLNK